MNYKERFKKRKADEVFVGNLIRYSRKFSFFNHLSPSFLYWLVQKSISQINERHCQRILLKVLNAKNR